MWLRPIDRLHDTSEDSDLTREDLPARPSLPPLASVVWPEVRMVFSFGENR